MKIETVKAHIEANLSQNEKLVSFFLAQKRWPIYLIVLIGPIAWLSLRQYYVGVSDKGLHFHKLNIFGRPSHHDYFSFDEIELTKFDKGLLQRPVTFHFKNGRKLKLFAQVKGVKSVPKLQDETVNYIESSLRAA